MAAGNVGAGALAGMEGDEALLDQATKQVFASYVCTSVSRGMPHPGDIAEASSLSAISLPPSDYPLWDALPPDVVAQGKLSQLQLEGILYACTKHCELLPSGERAGFFIGDGAGVGKGRQIAGVIIDNYVRGRKRAVWLSTSTDLHVDALRDMRDLGCHVTVINGCQALDRETRALGLSKEYQEGVLFLTYSTLVSGGKGRSRLSQVVEWLTGNGKEEAGAYEGLIVFDECHKAKNFAAGKEGASTKVATTVIELQRMLPKARVLYCSATGVSEVGHMAYMVRMGLWGAATAFPDFDAFVASMRQRGVSFLEMLAMEMKAEAKYVARGLSFKDAEFSEVEAPLEPRQAAMYDSAVQAWRMVKRHLETALALTGAGRDVWKVFWACQQRFFKLLCVSLKVPTVVAESRAALASGMAVVIGLQSTGEAAADAVGLEPGPCPGFVSPTKELLLRFVAQHFPLATPVAAGSAAAHGRAAEAFGGAGAGAYDGAYGGGGGTQLPAGGAGGGGLERPVGQPIPECVELRDELLQLVDGLVLPPNFLDHIIDELGGPGQVAEMTGRKGRVVREGGRARGRTVYELRAKPDSGEMDSLNVSEKDAFMCGRKLVAIISDAASTGISLHAARYASNQRRRLHLTIELPWSADKAIQQLGRSHRSNQSSAPVYKLVVTRVGGEKRFAAAVARRLQSLGALTRGDRRAASGVDLSDSNLDSPLGRKSLKRMYEYVVRESRSLPQGVTLAALFKDHHGLTQEAARSLFGTASGGGGGSGYGGHVSDRHVAEEQVAQLHRSFREWATDVMGVDLPAAPVKGGGGGDTVAEDTAAAGKASQGGDVRRFLNRLLGLPLDQQGLMFNYFALLLAEEIRAAKAEGKYSEGLADLAGSRIQHTGGDVLWRDPLSGRQTLCHTFAVDRGLSFEDAVARLARERLPGDDSGFRRGRRLPPGAPAGSAPLVLLALQKPGQRNMFSICRPNTGASHFDMERDELDAKYELAAEAEDVRQAWQAMYDTTHEHCCHGPGCRAGAACTAGRRLQHVSVLSGSVVRVWGVLEEVLARHERMLPRMDQAIRVVRVEWDDPPLHAHAHTPSRSTRPLPASGGGAGGQQQQQQHEEEDAQRSGSGTPRGGGAVGAPAGDSSPVLRSPAGADGSSSGSGGSGSGGSAGCRRSSDGGEDDRSGGGGTTPRAQQQHDLDPDVDPGRQHHLVGVRYPSMLLTHVVAMLQSLAQGAEAQQLLLSQQQAAGGGALGAWRLARPGAAASGGGAGAGGAAVVVEVPAPVDRRCHEKAFRAPKTLLDFFRAKEQASAKPQPPPAAAGGAECAAAAVAGSSASAGSGRRAHARISPSPEPGRTPAAAASDGGAACASGRAAALQLAGLPPAKRPKLHGPCDGAAAAAAAAAAARQSAAAGSDDSDIILLSDDDEEGDDVIPVPHDRGRGVVTQQPKQPPAARAQAPAAAGVSTLPPHPAGLPPARQPAAATAAAAAAAGRQTAAGAGPLQRHNSGGGGAYGSAAAQPHRPGPSAGAGGAYGALGGAAPGGKAAPGQHAAALSALQGMGFSGPNAERALWMVRGDLQQAVELCLRGM